MMMRMTLFGMKDEMKKTNMFERLLIDSTQLYPPSPLLAYPIFNRRDLVMKNGASE
jgi:hypothetical protein